MLEAFPKYSWHKIWFGVYVIACVLAPPTYFHGKYFFAPEYLLLPLVIEFFWKFFKRQIPKTPAILWLVLAATTLAFFSGIFRGDIGRDIGIYDSLLYDSLIHDQFSLGKDGIAFIRWSLIFFYPWVVASLFRD